MADLACTQCTVLKDFQCIQCTVHNSAWAVAMHSVHSAFQNLCRTVLLHSALCTVCGVGRCGIGGKVNTRPGRQNARFKGSKIQATRPIQVGEEIFVPY